MGKSVISRKKIGNVLIGLMACYLVFSGNRGLWNLYKLHQEKQLVTEQISELNSDIKHYQTEYQNLEKNTNGMEKRAREELNLVKPGEVVYKFTNGQNE